MYLQMAQGALGVFGAFQQSNQAEQQAMIKKSQIEWGNHMARMQTARQNRKIATANAAQWMMNQEITKGAYQQEAEESVYLRHRVDNELGNFSRNVNSQTTILDSTLESRNIKGGTARALFNATRAAQDEIILDQSVNVSNKARDITRKREGALAQRNFSYNDYAKFMPTDSSHIDPKAAGKQALMGGLLKTGIAALSGLQQHGYQEDLKEFRNVQKTRWEAESAFFNRGSAALDAAAQIQAQIDNPFSFLGSGVQNLMGMFNSIFGGKK